MIARADEDALTKAVIALAAQYGRYGYRRITELLKTQVPDSIAGKLAMLPRMAEIAKYPPRAVAGSAPCQQVVLPEHDAGIVTRKLNDGREFRIVKLFNAEVPEALEQLLQLLDRDSILFPLRKSGTF